MVFGDSNRMNMLWQVRVIDADDNKLQYVYHGGAFVDVFYDGELTETFSVFDFINGVQTVNSVEQLLQAIERKMYAAKQK